MINKIIQSSYDILYPRLTDSQYELLKIVAILSMISAHVGYLFFPDNVLLEVIGRAAMPLFSFLMVYSYINHTRSPVQYILRILFIAVISQYPYVLIFHPEGLMMLNIMFTLALGLFIIYIVDYAMKKENDIVKYSILYGILTLSLMAGLFVDYIYLGIILIFSYWVWLAKTSHKSLSFALFATAILNLPNGPLMAASTFLGIIAIMFITQIDIKVNRLNKWFYYGFYPSHLLLLYWLSLSL